MQVHFAHAGKYLYEEDGEMTFQTLDQMIYEGLPFVITHFKGDGYFDPEDEDISPVYYSTACWRGFWCGYEMLDRCLWLTSAAIGLNPADAAKARKGKGPRLFGRRPTSKSNHCGFVYEGLHELIPFTGYLVLEPTSRDLHPAPPKEYELRFQSGRLVESLDYPRGSEPHAPTPERAMTVLEQLRSNLDWSNVGRETRGRWIEESITDLDDNARSLIQVLCDRLLFQTETNAPPLPPMSEDDFKSKLRASLSVILRELS